MARRSLFSPLNLPIYGFLFAIATGAVLLRQDFCLAGDGLSWIDAVFTATSAVCVTGLIVVDTGSFFSQTGQSIILLLIQLGGLGVMTYSSLALYLWRKRVSLTDRLLVGQSLLHDPAFDLGRFLLFMVAVALGIEALGALILFVQDPVGFSPFHAVFHSISAFCNAGFSTYSDSLMAWQGSIGVNLVFIVLITLGGLGFSVLNESSIVVMQHMGFLKRLSRRKLGYHSRIVLRTSLFLSLGGAVAIFAIEMPYWLKAAERGGPDSTLEVGLAALFQSVTCRTAGFNTVDVGAMSNVSLFLMMILMFIGGSPGSCAGGVKTTAFRSVAAFVLSQVRGREQTVIGNRALDNGTVNKALTLTISAIGLVTLATLVLVISESEGVSQAMQRKQFFDTLFEAVSAFGTVGLSTGITPQLNDLSKSVLIVLMFTGRLGPILFLSVLQSWQVRPRFSWPDESLMIG